MSEKLTVGELFKMIRTQYCSPKLNQLDVADKMGVGRTFIAAIENGSRLPPDSMVEKFAMTYGRNATDRSYFLRELRLAISRVKSDGAKILQDDVEKLSKKDPELLFIPYELQALIKDKMFQKGLVSQEIAKKIKASSLELEGILEGRNPIKKSQFLKMVQLLDENPDEWLAFCGYIPSNVLESIQRFFSEHPEATFDDLKKKIAGGNGD